jgi:acetate kinase
MSDTILVFNAGSSSIKFELFAVGPGNRFERRMRGQIEGVGTRPRLLASGTRGDTLVDETWSGKNVTSVAAAFDKVVAFLRGELGGKLPTAIGHRVVHGGPDFSEPTIANLAVLDQLERYVPLAPLHQPNNLAPIRTVLSQQPQVLQVACFDTAFHRSHPEIADRYAIPDELYAEGVRRIPWGEKIHVGLSADLPYDLCPSGRVPVGEEQAKEARGA